MNITMQSTLSSSFTAQYLQCTRAIYNNINIKWFDQSSKNEVPRVYEYSYTYSSNIMIVEFSGIHKLYNYDYVNLNGLS